MDIIPNGLLTISSETYCVSIVLSKIFRNYSLPTLRRSSGCTYEYASVESKAPEFYDNFYNNYEGKHLNHNRFSRKTTYPFSDISDVTVRSCIEL